MNQEEWNPVQWRGSKWITLRETCYGLYAEIFYEIDRNKSGRVTLVPHYGWDSENQQFRNHGYFMLLEKNLSELLTEKQAAEKLNSTKDIHPATALIIQ